MIKTKTNIAGWCIFFFIIAGIVVFFISCKGKKHYKDWSVYGGSKQQFVSSVWK